MFIIGGRNFLTTYHVRQNKENGEIGCNVLRNLHGRMKHSTTTVGLHHGCTETLGVSGTSTGHLMLWDTVAKQTSNCIMKREVHRRAVSNVC